MIATLYKVVTMIAMLAVAGGMPAEKRLALLEAKAKVHDAMLAAKASDLDLNEADVDKADVDEQKGKFWRHRWEKGDKDNFGRYHFGKEGHPDNLTNSWIRYDAFGKLGRSLGRSLKKW